jgi:predicted nuclease with RNAse H fold
MGAVYLQNGVCLLPETDEHMRQLKMLENDAAEMGGETVLLVTKSLDKTQDEKVIARFKADRDDQYREFIGKCDAFEAEIAKEIAKQKFTFAELEEEDNDLKKLQSWIGKITALDFYGAPLAATASERMRSCEKLLADYAQRVFDANQGL